MSLPQEERPRFICAYFHIVDSAGHIYGPDSTNVNATVSEIDRAIGLLDAKLRAASMWRNTTLLIVSDHGMSGTSPTRKIVLDDIFDITRARIDERGPIATVTPLFINETANIYTKLRNASETNGHFQAYYRDSTPVEWHYRDNPRVAPIVLVADAVRF